MIQDPARRDRLRSTLKIILLATIPCYLIGFLVLWISNRIGIPTTTPTPTFSSSETILPTLALSPTMPGPATVFPTKPASATPTRFTPTITITYFLPSSTPSRTPSPTWTEPPTLTIEPTFTSTPEPTRTEIPTFTPTPVITEVPTP